jgi:uncharacterized protein DUF6778
MSMKRFTIALLGLAALGVSACASVPQIDVTQDRPAMGALPTSVVSADWQVQEIVINIPETLTVSESNRLKPRSDIVWREDPIGDRYAQVQAVMAEAMDFALRPMDGSRPVIVELELTRFHALTERARYTIGGEHEIEFLFTVRDAETGQALTGPSNIDLTFRAFGGRRAIESERNGVYQRDRIQSQIIGWARQEFGIAPPAPPVGQFLS